MVEGTNSIGRFLMSSLFVYLFKLVPNIVLLHDLLQRIDDLGIELGVLITVTHLEVLQLHLDLPQEGVESDG